MLKRAYYPIDKKQIQVAIDLYNEYCTRDATMSHDDAMELWGRACDAFHDICPRSYLWVANIFQCMRWCHTLDVEHVYYTILAMGANTKMEECDE